MMASTAIDGTGKRYLDRPYTPHVERILVTGAATWTGAGLVRRLSRHADTTIIGIDDIKTHIPAVFHQTRLDTLEFANRVVDLAPTTVIHLQTVHRATSTIPIATQTLLGALSRLSTVRRLIIRSDLAAHGTSPRLPSVLATETRSTGDSAPYESALRDMEASAGSFTEERPDITVTILRFAPIFGEAIDNALSRFLTRRVVPTILGYDPRLQFLHEDDAVRVLEHALAHPIPGTFDVAADGQTYLSRTLRLGRRIPRPLPERCFRRIVRTSELPASGLPEHLVRLFRHGRVVDPRARTEILGFRPDRNCRETVLAGYGRSS